jgi:transcriptional repressor NrdR
MKCPYCQTPDTAVLDSREADDQTSIRRRRVCNQCEKRFTTYERCEGIDLKVIKKDGEREDFSREKLRRGVVKATWKRPVSMSDIEGLLDRVESQLRQMDSTEIKSWEVGNLVLHELQQLDTLSSLLFASVYQDFSDLADFERAIKELKQDSSQVKEPTDVTSR